MRISYTDDEQFPGQFELWQANCERSLHGAKGQRELRELQKALLALPERRLIHGALIDEDGGVCAIGAYAKHKGLDLQQFDPEEETDKVGVSAGMPPLVAWTVVARNDFELDYTITSEQRYERMLLWIEDNLKKVDQNAPIRLEDKKEA